MLTVKSDTGGIAKAVDAIRAGQIVAYPTETVYGFGVDPMNDSAMNLLYEVKGRDLDKKVLLIVSSYPQLNDYVDRISESGQKLIRAFWPGPLSLLFTPKTEIPKSLLGNTGKICIRQTSHPVATALCELFGGAIVSTSANASGMAPARSVRDIQIPGIAVCIDGGELETSVPSTIYDIANESVIREGAITSISIEKTLSL
jgi:L-threonylcarbamoyladenylate synthase